MAVGALQGAWAGGSSWRRSKARRSPRPGVRFSIPPPGEARNSRASRFRASRGSGARFRPHSGNLLLALECGRKNDLPADEPQANGEDNCGRLGVQETVFCAVPQVGASLVVGPEFPGLQKVTRETECACVVKVRNNRPLKPSKKFEKTGFFNSTNEVAQEERQLDEVARQLRWERDDVLDDVVTLDDAKLCEADKWSPGVFESVDDFGSWGQEKGGVRFVAERNRSDKGCPLLSKCMWDSFPCCEKNDIDSPVQNDERTTQATQSLEGGENLVFSVAFWWPCCATPQVNGALPTDARLSGSTQRIVRFIAAGAFQRGLVTDLLSEEGHAALDPRGRQAKKV